ncbi:molybdenum cofactor synthesis domain protein [Dactylococcopsis salina PCC 8305]|uniref:Molybdenum cofactor biosynthesis protein B n=1 Tax=Dactylococcopsis salina (strain PCC 8305) TaxID=13035 RepID=K9YV12_DACS8|nr:MogA/MoaB family molybdenum cofactor biosynthesis protein [Dactylococcopsis salina]AFZ50357.1 molybdenum cofactor synthesis domain protein [Dactylococcopsis salina PCC 8305]
MMSSQPHPDRALISINCAIVTISDTRSKESDRSGQLIQEKLEANGHQIQDYTILKDDPEAIINHLKTLRKQKTLEVIICNGGTGIAPRDTTYDALAQVLDKTLPGFGELFRYLSYQEIGSRAIASRAIAGVYSNQLIFSLPGSTKAVQLGLEKLILPELVHLVKQLDHQ